MAEKRKGKRRRDEVRGPFLLPRDACVSPTPPAYQNVFLCVCVWCFSRSTAWTPRPPTSPAKSSTPWPRGCANKCRTRRPSSPDTTSNTLRVGSAIRLILRRRRQRFLLYSLSLSLGFVFRLVGSKAVDSLLESKWATSDKLFTTRQEIEMFLDL